MHIKCYVLLWFSESESRLSKHCFIFWAGHEAQSISTGYGRLAFYRTAEGEAEASGATMPYHYDG